MRSVAVSLLLVLSASASAQDDGFPALEADAEGMLQALEDHGFRDVIDLKGVGRADRPQGIVNGTEVNASSYENVVALAALPSFGNGGFIFCSASLIDQDWVLTASHCVLDLEYLEDYGYGLYVLFGGDIINDGYTDAIEWDWSTAHPQYDDQLFINDIGLIELKSSKFGVDFVVLNDEIITANMYGDDLTILGYGITTDGAYNAGTKRITEIPMYDHDGSNIYTYDPNTNVCQGDSGGPSFETTGAGDLEQVGVNAFVSGGCVGGAAGLTRVDLFIPWIQGYAPNVLLSGSGAGSGGTEPTTETTTEPTTEPTTDTEEPSTTTGDDDDDNGGTNSGDPNPEPADDLSADEIDRDLSDAPRPDGYPLGCRCDSTHGSTGVAWTLALAGLASVSRRRIRSAPQ